MVKKILDATGIPYKETRFLKPPTGTYAVYSDSFGRRGGDDINLITEHDITIELYEYVPDNDSEAKIELELDKNNIEYEKQARYWLKDEQLYQIVYEFSYITKGE